MSSFCFIKIEHIAANALIELFERRKQQEVSFDLLVRYSEKVQNILEQQFGERILLLISRKYQINMMENYPQFFNLHSEGNDIIISLKNDDPKTLDALKVFFRLSMNSNFVKAFTSREALKILLA